MALQAEIWPDEATAERFIQTALREWAYARPYQNSEERLAQLAPRLHDYNFIVVESYPFIRQKILV